MVRLKRINGCNLYGFDQGLIKLPATALIRVGRISESIAYHPATFIQRGFDDLFQVLCTCSKH